MNFKKVVLLLAFVAVLPAFSMEHAHKDFDDFDEQKSKTEKAAVSTTTSKIVSHNFDTPLPADLQKQLASKQAQISTFLKSNQRVIFNILPGWVIKKEAQKRKDGAKVCAAGINTNNYDQLTVPEQYFTEQYVIEKQVIPIAEKINLTQTQQLYALAHHLWWTDAHDKNYIKVASNCVAIVDVKLPTSTATNDKLVQAEIATTMLNVTTGTSPFDEESRKFLEKCVLENSK